MNEGLQQALLENTAFNEYLSRFPLLADTVSQKVGIVECTLDATSAVELAAGRDAMSCLHRIAREAGFGALAALFYESYEGFCDRLMQYL